MTWGMLDPMSVNEFGQFLNDVKEKKDIAAKIRRETLEEVEALVGSRAAGLEKTVEEAHPDDKWNETDRYVIAVLKHLLDQIKKLPRKSA